MVDESIWAPVLDAPVKPKEDAIGSAPGDKTIVEVQLEADKTPEAPPAAMLSSAMEAVTGAGALTQRTTLLQPLLLTWRPAPLLLTWQPNPADDIVADVAAGVDADATADSAADMKTNLSIKAPAKGM